MLVGETSRICEAFKFVKRMFRTNQDITSEESIINNNSVLAVSDAYKKIA